MKERKKRRKSTGYYLADCAALCPLDIVQRMFRESVRTIEVRMSFVH